MGYFLFNYSTSINPISVSVTILKLFDVQFNDLELGLFKDMTSKVMVPIDSPWVVSYLT